MDIGGILKWLAGLGLSGFETLMVMAIIALAAALVAYWRRAEQQAREHLTYEREVHKAEKGFMQTMLDRTTTELGKYGQAAITTAATLDKLDERVERIERAMIERRR